MFLSVDWTEVVGCPLLTLVIAEIYTYLYSWLINSTLKILTSSKGASHLGHTKAKHFNAFSVYSLIVISRGLFCFEKNVSLEFRVYVGNGIIKPSTKFTCLWTIKLIYIFLTEVLLNYYIFLTNVLLIYYLGFQLYHQTHWNYNIQCVYIFNDFVLFYHLNLLFSSIHCLLSSNNSV